jgi:hypothetical protein
MKLTDETFHDVAAAIVETTEATVPIDVARAILHYTLRRVDEGAALRAELVNAGDMVDRMRGAMTLAAGQLQAGNIRGAHEILVTNAAQRGHNARIEGN